MSGADPSLACPAATGCGGEGPLTWGEIMDGLKPLREHLRKQPRFALAGVLEGYVVSELVCCVPRGAPRQEQLAALDLVVGRMREDLAKWKPLARADSAGRRVDRILAKLDRAERGPAPKRRKRRKPRRAV